MTTVENILLIVLAAGFLLLLALVITGVLLVVKILRSVQRMSQKAESATDNLSDTVMMVVKKLAPLVATSVAGLVVRKVTSHKNRRGNHE